MLQSPDLQTEMGAKDNETKISSNVPTRLTIYNSLLIQFTIPQSFMQILVHKVLDNQPTKVNAMIPVLRGLLY